MAKADNGRWLIIPVEIQVRELLGRLLIGTIAASRGYNVLIGHDRVVRRLARHLPKGILFDKALGMKGDKKIARYQKLGFKITALDEEATGMMPNPEYFLSTRLAPESLAGAERWFAISDAVRDYTTTVRPGQSGKIVTVGLPRTDVWRPAFRRLYENQTQAIRNKHGKFLLFCSNFGAIVHAQRGRFVDGQYRRHQTQYAEALIYNEKMEAQIEHNLDAFIEMIPKLRKWFPDHKVIVRPHPVEDRNYWRSQIGHIDGVELHDAGVATPWILASDCMVHHGCTTGIEAELMGKGHIMYAPHRDDHHDTPVMETFAPIVKDERALRQAIAKVIDNPDVFRKGRQSLETHYASLHGRLVAEKIVDEFDKISLSPAGQLGRLAPLRLTPRHLVASYWPRSAEARAYSLQKWQGVDPHEIRRSIDVMIAAAKLDKNIAANEVFPQLFHLRSA